MCGTACLCLKPVVLIAYNERVETLYCIQRKQRYSESYEVFHVKIRVAVASWKAEVSVEWHGGMQRSPLSPICPILSHQHLGAPACRFLVACVCQSVYQPICPAFDGDMKRRVNPRERVILSSSLQREDNLLAMLAKMWIDRKGALTLFLSASVILFARGSEAHSDPIGKTYR